MRSARSSLWTRDSLASRPVATERAALLFAVLSGALQGATLPPFELWPIAFISLVPLLLATRGRSPARAFALGMVQGLVVNTFASASWLPATIGSLAGMGPAASVALASLGLVWHAARMALVMAAVALAERAQTPQALSFPILLVVAEWLYPTLLPCLLGEQVASVPLLCQTADIGGPLAISAWLALLGAAITDVAERFAREHRLGRELALALAAPLAVSAYGAVRMHAIDAAVASAPEARVAIVQPNVAFDGRDRARQIARAAERTSVLRRTPGVDLVVWPESVFGQLVREAEVDQWAARFKERGPAAPLVVGSYVGRNQDIARTRNTALLIDDAGHVAAQYDKRHPLTFGEYVPFADRIPALNRLLPRAGSMESGERFVSFDVAGHRVTPLICYEDMLPALVDAAVKEEAPALLVTITNDSWFGRTSAWRHHLASARLRAIEHRRFSIRAANDAGSAIVDPVGRLTVLTPHVATDAFASVRWLAMRTPFETLGQGGFVAILLLVSVALSVRRAPPFARAMGWALRRAGA